MTFQQLKYIVEVSKYGSITAAAQNLLIAQPSLSKAIKELECELNCVLLKRNRRGITFTTEGIEFLEYANHILEQFNSLHEHFNQEQENQKKINLTISSQHYIFVVDTLIYFMNQHKSNEKCSISLHEGLTSQVINDVTMQKSQIGFIAISNTTARFMNRLFAKNNLEFTVLFQSMPYAYMSYNHPLSNQASVTLEELSEYPYIRYSQGINSYQYQYTEEPIIPEKAEQVIYVTDRSAMQSIIKHTTAYTIGTGYYLKKISNKDIFTIPISNPINKMTVGWLKSKHSPMLPEMKEYVNLICQSLTKSESSAIRKLK